MISFRQESAIKNSFVHLLRNSLDHGIETPAIRRAKGKNEHGHILLKAEQVGGLINMQYQDDGAGLHIAKLREKGMNLKLIQSEATLQEVADLIFHQGMSTAQSVTMISGRGVGMDAVRRFIEAENGQVQIHIDELIDPENERYSFHFLISLPSADKSDLDHDRKIA